ncbi:UNVERIFIED_CONTAM: hypothetical protein GTU68_043719 [Idotea baltica]|nr:hypothetical protein [Idotea baltica]
MYLGQSHEVFSWFKIHFIENEGMAFGMELGGEYGKLILTVFRIIAVSGLGYLLYRLIKDNASTTIVVCISMILAGALGNIIDSVLYGQIFSESGSYGQVAMMFPDGGGYAPYLYGRVVDMLYFPLIDGHWPNWMPFVGGDYFSFFRPVFNVADSFISLGIFFMIVFERSFLFGNNKDESETQELETEVIKN